MTYSQTEHPDVPDCGTETAEEERKTNTNPGLAD